MTRTLEDPDLDDGDRRLLVDVRDRGWHVLNILEDGEEPGWSFTVGLATTFQHPELVVVGLKLELMHLLLNNLAETIREGRRYTPGETITDLLEDYSCKVIKVDRAHYHEWLGYACWYHQGDDFDALQVVWPDTNHVLPTDPAAPAALIRGQPLLGPHRTRIRTVLRARAPGAWRRRWA